MIHLRRVVPDPLQEQCNPHSEIWNTDCYLPAGRHYAVSAASGRGKSTLVHLLYGLRHDYTGTVNIADTDLRSLSAADWAEQRTRHTAIVFQDLRLFPHLSGLDNILLKNDLTRHCSSADIARMAEHLGIGDILQQSVATLSFGQRQRVAIVRALCQPFRLLLLDEPFSHLDPHNIKLASQLLWDTCHQQQATLLMVTLDDLYGCPFDRVLHL